MTDEQKRYIFADIKMYKFRPQVVFIRIDFIRSLSIIPYRTEWITILKIAIDTSVQKTHVQESYISLAIIVIVRELYLQFQSEKKQNQTVLLKFCL